MTVIPRSVVAQALRVKEATLPDGDLPIQRLAERYHLFLAAPEETAINGPEGWTFSVVDGLVQDHPALAFQVIVATLALCDTADQIAVLAAGPTEDLIRQHGASFIDRIEAAAEVSARFRFLLSGVWQTETPALLWARIEAARAPGPDMDAGDPLPLD